MPRFRQFTAGTGTGTGSAPRGTVLNGITIEKLRAISAQLRQNAEPVLTVKSKSQAKRMTATDPFGCRWNVGQRYYKFLTTTRERTT